MTIPFLCNRRVGVMLVVLLWLASASVSGQTPDPGRGGVWLTKGVSLSGTFTTLNVTGATTLDSTLAVVGGSTFNDAGADLDFRVESDDDASMLFVDGADDRVGIGTNAPTHTLTVVGSARTDGSDVIIDRLLGGGAHGTTGASSILYLNSHTGSSNNNSTEASLRFSNDNTLKWQAGMLGQVASALTDFEIRNAVSESTPFVMYGASNLAVFNEDGEDSDFRVESNGGVNMLFVDGGTNRVGIGTGGPVSTFHVQSTDVLPITLQRDSGTAGHGVGFNFLMGNSGGAAAAEQYATMYPYIETNTAGSEDANFVLNLKNDGSMTEIFRIFGDSGGMGFGSTDDPGTDSLHVAGTLSKGSGSFKIDHPLTPETHHLVHSFIEGPRADLIYRGSATIEDGEASVNIDDFFGMTTGTWEALTRNPQVWVSNVDGWEEVRGVIDGGTLMIESRDATATDVVVNWLVVAERDDLHIIEAEWTDTNGNPILEPVKPPPSQDPNLNN